MKVEGVEVVVSQVLVPQFEVPIIQLEDPTLQASIHSNIRRLHTHPTSLVI